MNDYPEHDKLHAIKGQSQTVGEFLEWLDGQGIWLARYHEHTEGCLCDSDHHENKSKRRTWCQRCGGTGPERRATCGYSGDQLAPTHLTRDGLLAAFFKIDRDKLEAEKRGMLNVMRRANG